MEIWVANLGLLNSSPPSLSYSLLDSLWELRGGGSMGEGVYINRDLCCGSSGELWQGEEVGPRHSF